MELAQAYLDYQKRIISFYYSNDVMNRITDKIWLGSSRARFHLKENNITAVISLVSPHQHERILSPLKIPEYRINLYDSRSARIIDIIYKVTHIIENSDEIFLIHCMKGKSRSAAVLIGYLMLTEGLHYEEAYERIARVRPCIRPNAGFIRQLKSNWRPQ